MTRPRLLWMLVLAVIACVVTVLATWGRERDDVVREAADASRAVPVMGSLDARKRSPRRRATSFEENEGALGPSETPEPSITGTVRWDDGTPVPDAFVALGDVDEPADAASSDAQGRFEMDAYPFYSSVTALAPRDGVMWRGSADADGVAQNLAITLRPPRPGERVVLVRVLGPDGVPIRDGLAQPVDSRDERRPWRSAEFHPGEVRVVGGRFAVAASRWSPGGLVRYVVTGPRGTGPANVEVNPDGAPVVEMQLPTGTTLKGRVERPDGTPGAGVVVTLAVYRMGVIPATVRFFDVPCERVVVADAEGRFEFIGLEAGDCEISVARAGSGLGGVALREVVAGGSEVVLRLRGVVDATVRVTDDSGRPVTDATVWALDRDEVVDRVDDAADGTYRLTGLLEGVALTLRVFEAGFCEVRRAWTPEDTHVTLLREARVTGRVIGPDGRALHCAPVTRGARRVETQGDGSFVVHDLAHGDVERLAIHRCEPRGCVQLRTPRRDRMPFDVAGPTTCAAMEVGPR